MSAGYEAEQEQLQLEIGVTEDWVEPGENMDDDVDAFVALTEKCVDVTELTPTIVNEYIKKIIVYDHDKSGSKRQQKIQTIFTFVEAVDIHPSQSLSSTKDLQIAEKRRDLRVTPFSACRKTKNIYLSVLSVIREYFLKIGCSLCRIEHTLILCLKLQMKYPFLL